MHSACSLLLLLLPLLPSLSSARPGATAYEPFDLPTVFAPYPAQTHIDKSSPDIRWSLQSSFPLQAIAKPGQVFPDRAAPLGLLFRVITERPEADIPGIQVHAQGLLLTFYQPTATGWALDPQNTRWYFNAIRAVGGAWRREALSSSDAGAAKVMGTTVAWDYMGFVQEERVPEFLAALPGVEDRPEPGSIVKRQATMGSWVSDAAKKLYISGLLR